MDACYQQTIILIFFISEINEMMIMVNEKTPTGKNCHSQLQGGPFGFDFCWHCVFGTPPLLFCAEVTTPFLPSWCGTLCAYTFWIVCKSVESVLASFNFKWGVSSDYLVARRGVELELCILGFGIISMISKKIRYPQHHLRM